MARKPDPVGDAFAAAMVLAWRLPMLWAMAFNPTQRRQAEAWRMVTEKTAAAAEAAAGAQAELALAFLGPPRRETAERITNAVLKPAMRRMRANAARLKRRKRL